MRAELVLCCLALTGSAVADQLETEFGGHTKLRLVSQGYPEDSVYHDLVGDRATDVSASLRLKFVARAGRWSFDSAYQLAGLRADSLAFEALPDDDDRFFSLTRVIHSSDDAALLHRIDRLSVAYTSEKAVLRFGRQALSWGNGLAYAPMDLVNPFDPSAIDTEYKAGDDMLYGQYLQDNGNDFQAAWVLRRDPVTGDFENDESTAAIKYHGFAGQAEFDLLVARSYGDTVLGVGFSRSIGGAVWSADTVVTDTDLDTYVQVVSNLLYSWNWSGRNMSGGFEYYFNGFGQRGGRYDAPGIAANPDLAKRLARGELFAVGRHYLSANVLVEMSPLWTVTPTMLLNIEDPSALLQLITSYSLGDNMTFLASLNVPIGPNGSEFGGIDAGLPGRYLSRGAGVFAQFAWYF
jgi:hypothetical protein